MKKCLCMGLSLLVGSFLQAAEYHVAPVGNDTHSGVKNAPFRTIQHAANLAQPGDMITVHEGVYRERVNPPRGGTSADKRIIYLAAAGEKVVIKGSEPVKGWVKEQHDTWRAILSNNIFGGFNPYADVIGGEWYNTPNDKFNRHTGAVYLNEDWLTEAQTLEAVMQPAAAVALWFAEADAENTTIRAQFKGVDPNVENVEINVRQSIFYPSEPGRNFITVRGFTMRHAATPWAGAMSEQVGLIGTHWSKGWIIEGNTIHDIGLRGWVKGADIAGLKLLGSVDTIIRNNHIYRCGVSGGIWLDWMAQGTRATGNLLHDNTWDLFMEVNHGPFLIDHNVFLSPKSLRDWSQGGAYAHNLFMGSFEARTPGRKTPYFRPHTVADMRLSGIRKTDVRFHNNLFAGGKGTAAFNTWSANLQANGNVYLAGSKPCTGEGGTVVNADFNPHVTLTEGPAGEWWLEMAVDPAWLTAQARPTVTTELLGTAVVPSQPFVQPDGTPYRLDIDYAGASRSANPAPGPSEFTTGQKIRRKVWPSGPTASHCRQRYCRYAASFHEIELVIPERVASPESNDK